MPLELLEAPAALLADHLFAVVFVAFLVDGAGLPFPSRLVLIAAATLAGDFRELVLLGVACTAGAIIGDHVPYLGGMMVGSRLLTLYCRLTLGSARCVERTIHYFRRFGAAAILMSRFSASIRIFASALSGCGHITYRRFVTYSVAGTVLYAVVWVSVGHLLGERVAELLERHEAARYLVLLGPVAIAGVLGYRLWRRARYGPAQPDRLVLEAECLHGEAPEATSDQQPSSRRRAG